MKKIIAAIFLSSFVVKAELQTSLILEKFHWSEYKNNGDKLLDEDGYREGVGFLYKNFSSKIILGEVDYDGQRWNGEAAKTSTDYLLINAELNKQRSFLNFGAGIDTWRRTLANEDKSLGGYSEYWAMLYGKIGITYKIFSLNYNMPFHCENNVHGITLKPDAEPFISFSTKFTRKNYFIGFAYTELNFNKSTSRNIGNGHIVHQPKSEQENISIFAGINW